VENFVVFCSQAGSTLSEVFGSNLWKLFPLAKQVPGVVGQTLQI
jgi:hypothetical protein